MRITPDMLWKIAEEAVEERVEVDPNIVAAFIYGSVLTGDPVLGGAADVDLVFIHPKGTEYREIERITEDVHIDIRHHNQESYQPAKALRTNVTYGSAMYIAKSLYDPQHFIDFTQASARGLYDSYDNVLGRAEPLLKAARQTWIGFHNHPPEPGPAQVWEYLAALHQIANAIALLTGPPLTTRRFLVEFPERCQAIDQGGLYFGLLGLMGVNDLDSLALRAWLPGWQTAYEAADGLEELHPHRFAYFYKGIQALLDGENPQQAAWPMIYLWTRAVRDLSAAHPARQEWQRVFETLQLTGDNFSLRIDGLDAYLDLVEEIFEAWKQQVGR